jgi:hypothetical protein
LACQLVKAFTQSLTTKQKKHDILLSLK